MYLFDFLSNWYQVHLELKELNALECEVCNEMLKNKKREKERKIGRQNERKISKDQFNGF